jgi:lysophospholipase L1-like esterase
LAKLIVIQLGSNDLGIKKTYELYSDIKLGLLRLKVIVVTQKKKTSKYKLTHILGYRNVPSSSCHIPPDEP